MSWHQCVAMLGSAQIHLCMYITQFPQAGFAGDSTAIISCVCVAEFDSFHTGHLRTGLSLILGRALSLITKSSVSKEHSYI